MSGRSLVWDLTFSVFISQFDYGTWLDTTIGKWKKKVPIITFIYNPILHRVVYQISPDDVGIVDNGFSIVSFSNASLYYISLFCPSRISRSAAEFKASTILNSSEIEIRIPRCATRDVKSTTYMVLCERRKRITLFTGWCKIIRSLWTVQLKRVKPVSDLFELQKHKRI